MKATHSLPTSVRSDLPRNRAFPVRAAKVKGAKTHLRRSGEEHFRNIRVLWSPTADRGVGWPPAPGSTEIHEEKTWQFWDY
jgi:hypothetical protein